MKNKNKQKGGMCPVCLLPLAIGAAGVGSIGYGLSTKSKSKSKSKSKLTKSKLTKSKKGGKRIIKGGSPPKKTKKKSMKGRLTRHRKPTPPSPPKTLYEMIFGKAPKQPKPLKPSPPKKTIKEMKKDPNYKKLSKIIAKEMKIPISEGNFVYKQNSNEKKRHDTKTTNLYNALYE
jgi:hypothetical protein